MRVLLSEIRHRDLETDKTSNFRREVEGLGGYDTKVTGQRVL